MKTNSGHEIIIREIGTHCIDIYVETVGYIGRVFKPNLEKALKIIAHNEYAPLYSRLYD